MNLGKVVEYVCPENVLWVTVVSVYVSVLPHISSQFILEDPHPNVELPETFLLTRHGRIFPSRSRLKTSTGPSRKPF